LKNKSDISKSTWLSFAFLCLFGVGIFGRIIFIPTAEAEKWEAKGKAYEQKIKLITPVRGQIYSSDGSLLATSVPVYELRWDSRSTGMDIDEFSTHIDSLSFLFSNAFGIMSPREYKELLKTAQHRGDRYARIATNLSYTKMKEIKEFPFVKKGSNSSGFLFERKDIRKKPFDKLAARTIGLDRDGARVGLELAYNLELGGKEGQQIQEKIAGGVWKPVTNDYIVEPEMGCDVYTSIDVHLQDVATTALERQLIQHDAAWGTVILMEVSTGYIKAIANLSRDEEGGSYSESHNKAIAELVEPGSTFKLPVMMAVFDDGLFNLGDSIDTGDGIHYFYDRSMKDSNYKRDGSGGNGILSVEEVFEKSSNIGTALLVKKAYGDNPQKFLNRLGAMGLQESLGIKIKGEQKPQLYSKVGEGNWSGLSLTQMAIGYEVLQTPLQTLAFYNAVANNGVLVRPQFVTEVRKNGKTIQTNPPIVLRSRICSPSTLEKCRKMLEGVCEAGGTADYIFKGAPYSVAGKTGTAKIAKMNGYYADRYRASFVGYFPAEAPKYSCLVLINDTRSGVYYGSTIAGPVFRELADKIYATEFELRGSDPESDLAQAKLPAAKNGSRKELQTVYDALKIATIESGSSEWVRTKTGEKSVELTGNELVHGLVPDVRGMGLQDALFLLENLGLKVKIAGSGMVKKQSVVPGARLDQHNQITIELG
jgi:cell division protein FtsI (penicillin-binding protein 3)